MSYQIRQAVPSDVPAIREHCRQQNERDGTNYPVPQIFDEYGRLMPMIALALVIVDESGAVQQGVVFEKHVEMELFGCDPKATATLRKEIEAAFYLLRQQGYQTAHTFIPKQVVIPIERPLRKVGFMRDDFRLAHFCRDLTQVQEED